MEQAKNKQDELREIINKYFRATTSGYEMGSESKLNRIDQALAELRAYYKSKFLECVGEDIIIKKHNYANKQHDISVNGHKAEIRKKVEKL